MPTPPTPIASTPAPSTTSTTSAKSTAAPSSMLGTSLCEQCTALCCRYFALPIDNPTTPRGFDDIRWYLAHENVHVFVEEGQWYLAVQTRCRYLQEDNACGIYEDRPRVCREYSTDHCDYHIGTYEFEQYFTGPEQLEAYAQATLGKRYTQWCLKERQRNTGQISPDSQEVLGRRSRPILKGHPSANRQHAKRVLAFNSPSGGAQKPSSQRVELSIRGVKR